MNRTDLSIALHLSDLTFSPADLTALISRETARIDSIGARHPLFGWGLYKRASRTGDAVALNRRARLAVWRTITGTPEPR